MKYFVIVDPNSVDSFLDSGANGPAAYDSEVEAIAAAKNYRVCAYVVKATVSVIPVERHKVTKLA